MKQKQFVRLNAFIPVNDLRETLDYYRDQLGFTEEWTMGTDGGIRRDTMRLIFGQDPDYVAVLNNDTYRFVLIWFVENVDEIYREFKEERKLTIVSEIENKPWGIREFSFHDINGYLIRVSEGIAR